MIVEFVGLMGAGKTTLQRRAVERLEVLGQSFWTPGMIAELYRPHRRRFATGRRVPIARPLRFLFRLWASWWSRDLVSIAVRHLIMSGRPYDDTLRGLRWFLTDLGSHWAARLRIPQNHIVLFDEGLVQRAINLFVHGRGTLDLSGVRRYAHAVPPPDVLVYVMVDPEVAIQRAAGRSTDLSSRFRGLSQVELRAVFANAARALDVLITEICKSNKRPVTVVAIHANELETANLEFDTQVNPLLVARNDSAPASRALETSGERDRISSVRRNKHGSRYVARAVRAMTRALLPGL